MWNLNFCGYIPAPPNAIISCCNTIGVGYCSDFDKYTSLPKINIRKTVYVCDCFLGIFISCFFFTAEYEIDEEYFGLRLGTVMIYYL